MVIKRGIPKGGGMSSWRDKREVNRWNLKGEKGSKFYKRSRGSRASDIREEINSWGKERWVT